MKLPFLDAPEQSVDMLTQFGGYNHRLNVAENQFFDMQNMSSRDYPVISTRQKRGVFTNDSLASAQTIVAKDNIVFAFTGYGDIGIEIAQDVPQGVLQSSTIAPDEEEIKYTRVTECNSNALANHILDNNDLASFGMYKYANNTLSAVTGTKPTLEIVDEDGKKVIQAKQPHGMIAATTLWAKQLFALGKHWYSLDRAKVSATSNGFLSTEENRALLIGKTVHINSVGERTIVSINPSKTGTLYPYDDWIIEFDQNLPESCEKKAVYVKLTEPLSATIPAVSEEIKEDDAVAEEINKPTKVKVTPETDSHLKVLKGKSVDFIDNEGTHTCLITDYEIDGADRYIYIELPHDALQTGATAYGDRLYLCEYNPFTDEAITSDIFSASDKPHTLLEMGANVVIFPEKIMVNTQKRDPVTKQFNDIQQLELTDMVASCNIKLTDANGNKDYVFGKDSIGITAPEEPENKQVWIDVSTDPPTFRVYSSQIEQWAKTQTYCEISSDLMKADWEIGDAVELDFEDESIFGDIIVPVKDQKYFVISAVGENFIRFPVAMKAAEKTTDKLLTIKRTVPDMDFVIENENRLWGCKYGEVDGEMINEIFACKLGDPKNWHCFANTSMDSYYVSLGADGEFTGAYTYQGSPFFFREGCIHRIYGNYPANYSLKTINCHGVEKGSNKGITTLNEVMFYKSPVGIMAYTGATPVCVTENFGTERYKNAVAGAVGNKMYFSMQDSNGNDVLFTFDDSTKLWHKEDNLRCKDMVVFENDVYALSANNELLSMEGSAGVPEKDFEWFIESGNFGYTTPFFKRMLKADIRLQMDRGARASLYIQYDSSGDWQHITDINAKGDVRSISIPVQPHRCDHFKLKLKGKGGCKLISIAKVIEGGSDNE